MTKAERKKFTVEYCKEAVKDKGSKELIKFFESGKRDDVADTIMQLNGWKLKRFIGKIKRPKNGS
jgi:hypothetical protein